jgi:hypothetical protein
MVKIAPVINYFEKCPKCSVNSSKMSFGAEKTADTVEISKSSVPFEQFQKTVKGLVDVDDPEAANSNLKEFVDTKLSAKVQQLEPQGRSVAYLYVLNKANKEDEKGYKEVCDSLMSSSASLNPDVRLGVQEAITKKLNELN